MKISDLFEDKQEDFENDLKKRILDVIMLYQSTDTPETSLNNVIYELKKAGVDVYPEELETHLNDMGFDVANGKVKLKGKENADDELEDIEDGEEYDEVDNMAKQATDKRVK